MTFTSLEFMFLFAPLLLACYFASSSTRWRNSAIAWTLQIYFDFSGYTDIAVGIGRMLGFRYPENFNYPYAATSVSDFWRRWHMSLSSFFRDYVYIPLGGNRVTMARWVLNMFVVWTLTGLWHGANWTFVAWGLGYGVLLVLERLVLGRVLERAPRPVSHAYVLLVTIVGWVVFMSPDLQGAGAVLSAMAGAAGGGDFPTLVLLRVIQPLYVVAMLAGVLGSFPWMSLPRVKSVASRPAVAMAADLVLVGLLVVSTAFTLTSTFNPFLYVRF